MQRLQFFFALALAFWFSSWNPLPLFAQVSNYGFQAGPESYTLLLQGNTLLPDDLTSPTVPIGFNFQYNGQMYDSVNVTEKAWLWFGPKSSFVAFPHPIGGPAFNGLVQGIVCAFGNDLIPQLFLPSAKVWYQTTGTAPNRIFTVEWQGFTRIQPVADGAADLLNNQIQFLETSNQIRMNYLCFGAPWSPQPQPGDISELIQVGLRGAGNQDFHIRNGQWTNPGKASQISDKITFNDNTQNEPKNLRFTWTPGPLAQTIVTGNIPSGTVCTATPYNLSFTTTGNFPSGTVFKAQLSNMNGSFPTLPVSVGEGTSSPISIQLPATAVGNGFRIRVVSQGPAVVGSPSQPFVSQNCCNTTIEPFGPLTLCQGDSLRLTAGEGLSYEWLPGEQTTRSIYVKSGGLFTVKVTKSATCIATASVSVSLIVPNPLQITANTTTLSPGQSTVLTANGGQLYTWFPPQGLSSQNGQTVIASPGVTTTYTAISTLSPSGCVARGQITITVENQGGNVAPVAIFPGTGTYDGPQTVGLSCSTPGSVIYYTLTGNNPVPGTTFTRAYSEPFKVLQTSTIKAIAMKPGMTSSPIQTVILTITNPGIVSNPVISPGSGSFNGSVEVSIATQTAGAQVWFTTNGNAPRLDVPNSFTRLYSGPFTIFQNTTIRAVAVKTGLQNSQVTLANLTVTEGNRIAPLAFNPAPGIYGNTQSVAISSATPDVQIWYTTNGNTPRLDIPNFFTRLYSTPLNISQTTQIKAIAVKTGFQPSPVATGNYNIGLLRSEHESGMKVEVFPNPARFENPTLRVESLGKDEPIQVTVMDLQGRVWISNTMEPGQTQQPINLRNAGKGLFLVQVVQGKESKKLTLKLE
jgi:hypothetical protein